MTSTLISLLLATIIQNTTNDDNADKEAILNGLHTFTYAGIAMTLTCCVLRCMYPAENKKLQILKQRIEKTQQRQAEIVNARYLKLKAKEARKRARNEAARIHTSNKPNTSLKTNSSSTGNDGSNELSSSSSSEDYSAVLDRKPPSSPENNETSSDDISISSDPLNIGYDGSNKQSSFNPSNSSEDNSIALTSIKTKNHQNKSPEKTNPIAQRIKARQAEKLRKAKEHKERKAKEDKERKAKEDKERKAKEDKERKAKEDKERKAKEDKERKLRSDLNKKKRLDSNNNSSEKK